MAPGPGVIAAGLAAAAAGFLGSIAGPGAIAAGLAAAAAGFFGSMAAGLAGMGAGAAAHMHMNTSVYTPNSSLVRFRHALWQFGDAIALMPKTVPSSCALKRKADDTSTLCVDTLERRRFGASMTTR